MSLIETAPQKLTKFDTRKQDHGDAAEQKGHQYKDRYWDQQGTAKKEAEHLKLALDEIHDYTAMTPSELDAAATELLGDQVVYESQTPDDEALGYFDEYTEEELDAIVAKDRFPTEAEFGLKSKHEIRKSMARRATIDVDFDDDDHGDNDRDVTVHIKNRL